MYLPKAAGIVTRIWEEKYISAIIELMQLRTGKPYKGWVKNYIPPWKAIQRIFYRLLEIHQ